MVEGIADSIVTQVTTETATSNNDQVSDVVNQDQGQDKDLANRLAILAKKEKGILTKQQEYQQKLKEFEEKNSKLSKWEEYEKLVNENPLEFFKKSGLSFEDLQSKMLQSLNDEDIDPIQKQLKELTMKLDAKDKQIEELLDKKLSDRDETEKQNKLKQQETYYQSELNKFLDSNKDDYELINAFDAKEDVFDVIRQVYLKTSEKGTAKLLTFKEASDLYEKDLASKLETMKELKKVKSIFGQQSEPDIFATLSGMKTLDDSFTQSSSTSPELKTDQERERAAAKLFEQQIKAI